MRHLFIYIFIFIFFIEGKTQLGGKDAFEFLNLPASARITALGGHLISVQDEDVTLALSNPASLNDKMHNRISFSHNFHFADIQNGYVAYARKLDKLRLNVHFGVQYINYGDFSYADVLGNQDGTFTARETAFVLGASKKIAERITIGANIKGVFSNLESYSSTGLLMDLGMNYAKDSSGFMLTLLVKNLGTELTTYNGTRFGMPLDVHRRARGPRAVPHRHRRRSARRRHAGVRGGAGAAGPRYRAPLLPAGALVAGAAVGAADLRPHPPRPAGPEGAPATDGHSTAHDLDGRCRRGRHRAPGADHPPRAAGRADPLRASSWGGA